MNQKPTALKIVNGTAQNCRLNKKEPRAIQGVPAPPQHLSNKAQELWPKLASLLDQMGVLSTTDVLALEGLAETYAELIAARTTIKGRGGETSYQSVTSNGAEVWKEYPEVSQIHQLDRRFRVWLGLCGLTPADRARVSVIAPDVGDDWSDL